MSEIPASDFDTVLPAKPKTLLSSPTRLVLGDKVFPLDNPHPDAGAIYHAIHAALLSDWFQETLGEHWQKQLKDYAGYFLNWLSEHQLTEANRFDVLNDYQAFRVNEIGVKPQSTGAASIVTLLDNGSDDDELTGQRRYLQTLCNSTKIVEAEERIPTTLTGWFAQMDWLRPIVGEHDWLAMESPKRLMASFSVTVASTLWWLLRVRVALSALVNKAPLVTTAGEGLKKIAQRNHYCRELLMLASRHASALPDGTLDLLLADFVRPELHEYCRSRLQRGQTVPIKSKVEGRVQEIFISPLLFTPHNWENPSQLEQQLAAWLCAWQTVQPEDITKLKPRHFTVQHNKQGRPVSLQCTYYKGRSGRLHEPPLLEAQQIEAKALIKYLKTSGVDNQVLFPDCEKRIKFTPDSAYTTLPRTLAYIWAIPTLADVIETQLHARSASDRFRRLYLAVAHHGSEAGDTWTKHQKRRKQPCDINAYKKAVPRPLPFLLFGLSAVKTSAVQARTDRYRDGDLVNVNSHSAATEKTSYMTDQNKEWVNQNGRITRIVLNDIENHAYKPNIEAALTAARERLLQTQVMQATKGQPVRINALGEVITPSPTDVGAEGEPDEHIVWDSPETVVCFLHYLAEAERQSSLLIAHALPFFERSVLPSAEWMSSLLNQGLSPGVVRAGKQQYEQLRSTLPPLFDNQLHGGVGT